MRKSLLAGGASLLALFLMFSACDDKGYDVTETETVPSLSGPGNLTAVNAHEGVITLTWDPVYDAETYEVWRKTGDEPAVQVSGSSNPLFNDGSIRFYDIISTTNVLKASTDYTYTVVAVSSRSTSVPRGVDVVQNGTSSVTIPAAEVTKIPAQSAYTVAKVAGLTVAKVTLPNGNQRVQVSWTKDANPGVWYRGTFNSSPFQTADLNLSPDGTKVVYNYNGTVSGEQKAQVTAYYATSYYNTGGPVESAAYRGIISNFTATPIELYTNGALNGSYDVSLYWTQTAKPDGLSYELYRHEGVGASTDALGWEAVTGVTIPTTGEAGLIQVTLSGDKVPAYRQAWTYKLVAKVGGAEVDSALVNLSTDPWTTTTNIQTAGSTYAAQVTGVTGRKIRVAVERVTSGLYTGDSIAFYAVPDTFYDSSNYPASDDTILSQFIPIGAAITKAELVGNDDAARTKESAALSAGHYNVIAVLKNGDFQEQISLYYNGVLPQGNWTATVTN
ncbi:MAG: fibronectin type III domain-containing protein [Treponema sp.]|jgi:hypothetical protein|nr:fibronectin type III domain-containing protein [Treponema sp.]